MSCTAFLYTPGGPGAKGEAPCAGRAPLARAACLSALLLACAPALTGAPAPGEETIRVRSPQGEVVELGLEAYVAGVVSGEMPASFPAEALKAQAVAARSYALTRKIEAQAAGRAHDIGSGVLAQVWVEKPGPAALAAAEATAGEVLVWGMEPVEAYFHAACGGRTETGLAALGRDLPYLVSVECGHCTNAPRFRWTVQIPAGELARAAGLSGAASEARVVARTSTGRAERVEIEAGGRVAALAAADLRRRLGYARLPSLAFDVKPSQGGFAFEGSGQGHGAGMCQWGAAGLAREGKTYRQILAYYYPGTEVVRMY